MNSGARVAWCGGGDQIRGMEKPKLKEHDGMRCRSCGNEERASEGYPCADCGTFICLICTFRGVTRCKACEEKAKTAKASPQLPPTIATAVRIAIALNPTPARGPKYLKPNRATRAILANTAQPTG